MACEDLFEEYEAAIEDFTDDWDSFNDADNNLENAAYDYWFATAMTWGAIFVGGVGGGIGLATMMLAQEKFEDAKEVYEREYNDLLDSYGDLQDKSQKYCNCRDY